jgi:Fe-S cluster assembly protein SufD
MSVFKEASNELEQCLENHLLKQELKDPLFQNRKKAWNSFKKVGLPTQKTPGYSYFPLNRFYTSSLKKMYTSQDLEGVKEKFSSKDKATLVFCNGEFIPSLSDWSAISEGVTIVPLSQAAKIFQSFILNRSQQQIKNDEDTFSLLNSVFHQEGAFIYVSPNVDIKVPIHVVHLLKDCEENAMTFSRVSICLGKGSKATLWESTVCDSSLKKDFVNQAIDIHLEEGSNLKFENLNVSEHAKWNFHSLRAMLKRNSNLESTTFSSLKERSCRQVYQVDLQEEGANVSLQGGWLSQGSATHHTHIDIRHLAPNCESMQNFKGVLGDASRSSFYGKIYVKDIAQQTQAYQLNNNLLLSDRAKSEALPNLEIFADDVKASHGATVGQLDEDSLFYLNSRGISIPEAKKMLVQGFCEDVFKTFTNTDFKKEVRKSVQKLAL